ncbi:hypothetical protein LGM95_22810 [Burkholderia arboris]|nr:hypothetical protein [Burkholderia arboris]MCA8049385.1 hypothetical protein [Burkholderia arboris]
MATPSAGARDRYVSSQNIPCFAAYLSQWLVTGMLARAKKIPTPSPGIGIERPCKASGHEEGDTLHQCKTVALCRCVPSPCPIPPIPLRQAAVNEKSLLARNASRQENGSAFEARGLSREDNGTARANLRREKKYRWRTGVNVASATTRKCGANRSRAFFRLRAIQVAEIKGVGLSIDVAHDGVPTFDACTLRLFRGLVLGVEVISLGRFDSVFANSNVRHPCAAGCGLYGLDDDFVTVEFVDMAFDSFVHMGAPHIRPMMLSGKRLYEAALLKIYAETAPRSMS